MEAVLVTGGFDPLHSGHISYLESASKLGDWLVVGINSDAWLKRKKGRHFMPFQERCAIIKSLRCVDEIIEFDDSDDTACDAIAKIMYTHNRCIFANGGDRTDDNIPEQRLEQSNLKFVFGVGGDNKANSSSWILEDWKAPKTQRKWGYYRVLYEYGSHTKLKELAVEPGQQLSMQRHRDRAEFWFVGEGEATVYTINVSSDPELRGKYTQHQSLQIPKTEWHMLANETDKPLKLIEIQYGDNCIENDIESKKHDKRSE
jgi:cytidyltransferase-like protein